MQKNEIKMLISWKILRSESEVQLFDYQIFLFFGS